MFRIDKFERQVRAKIKKLGPEDKIYLKKNYTYEIFTKHGVKDYEVDFLFDLRKIIRIYPSLPFPDERIDAEINAGKNRKIKVIFNFDPIVKGSQLRGKVGIITAFPL